MQYIALLAENEGDMDAMLDVVSGWCRKWLLRINVLKSLVLVVHFRKRRKRSDHVFCKFGEKGGCLDYTTSYKHLEVLFFEFATFKIKTENFTEALHVFFSKIQLNK